VEANQKCIQSYAPHGVKFLDKAKAKVGVYETLVEIPAGAVERNIVIVEEKVIEELMKDSTFKTLLDNKLVRILDNIPKRYEDATNILVAVKSKLADVQEAKVATDEKNVALSAENEDLKKRLAELEEEAATGKKAEVPSEQEQPAWKKTTE